MTLTFRLPLPPSVNEMLSLAKKRARLGKRVIPIVYDRAKERYERECLVCARMQRILPWPVWRIVAAEFAVHNERDPLELYAGAKWPVDWLVSAGYVLNDSPRELVHVGEPVQRIDRKHPGLLLTIQRVG